MQTESRRESKRKSYRRLVSTAEGKRTVSIIARGTVWKRKIEVLSAYSNGQPRCQCCNEKNPFFLSIDHINNDGSAHRKKDSLRGYRMYCWLKKNKYPRGFRVLCHNCNLGRQLTTTKICPHKSGTGLITT